MNYYSSLLFLDGFLQSFYLNFIKADRYMLFVKGFIVTLEITLFAIILGLIIGFIMAFMKLSDKKILGLKLPNIIASVYIDIIRGTPTVVQLLIIYFVIFGSVDIPKVLVAVIAFGINSGAYIAEIIRAGILAVDHGQMEAGRSLGFTYGSTMRYIIIPQAVKNILPAMANEFIVLLKETAIVGYIAVEDLTKAGDIVRSRTYAPTMPLLAVALMYLSITSVLSKMFNRLEGRLRQGDSR